MTRTDPAHPGRLIRLDHSRDTNRSAALVGRSRPDTPSGMRRGTLPTRTTITSAATVTGATTTRRPRPAARLP